MFGLFSGGGTDPKEPRISEQRNLFPNSMSLSELPAFSQKFQAGIKVNRFTQDKFESRTLKLQPDSISFLDTSNKLKLKDAKFLLKDLWEVRPGVRAETFVKAKGRVDENQCCSVLCRDGTTLHIQLNSQAERDEFGRGISALAERAVSLFTRNTACRIQTIWQDADRDGDGQLSMEEIKKLIKKMNLTVSSKKLKETFNKYDADGSGQLSQQEFDVMIRELTKRADVNMLFNTIPKADVNALSPAELVQFMTQTQGEAGWDLQRAQVAFQLFGCTNNRMLECDFGNFLFDVEMNGWTQPQDNRVWQDMNQPIQHYFINSSHNTYLSGDQLQSDSKVEMYVSALRRGCRCVELDVWDGPDGKPIVYHGFTRTSKIKFYDILVGINDHAFATTPYPVILSLEVHTSVPQQDVMAEMMRSVFKEKLALPAQYETMPAEQLTPELLKNKIVVKGKRLKPTPEPSADDVDPDDEKETKAPNTTASQKLSDCVLMGSSHFKSFDDYENGKPKLPWKVASYVETKAEKMLRDSLDNVIQMNKAVFSRIYPKGSRVTSDNYNPAIYWSAGNQLVALNFQTADTPTRINDAKFRQNGRAGYVLKPAIMRNPPKASLAQWDDTCRLTVKVISGYQFPSGGGGLEQLASVATLGMISEDIVDPYVKLFINGSAVDQSEDRPVKTNTVDDNGWDPLWNKEFTFDLKFGSLAMLTMQVIDEDPGQPDDYVGEANIPIESIRSGYRAVPLMDFKRQNFLESGKLLCHFSLTRSNGQPYGPFANRGTTSMAPMAVAAAAPVAVAATAAAAISPTLAPSQVIVGPRSAVFNPGSPLFSNLRGPHVPLDPRIDITRFTPAPFPANAYVPSIPL